MAIHSLPIPSTPQCPHSGSGHGRSSLILHGSPQGGTTAADDPVPCPKRRYLGAGTLPDPAAAAHTPQGPVWSGPQPPPARESGGSLAARWAEPCSWFHFPAEIRNMVYAAALRAPDCHALYRRYDRQLSAYYQRKAEAETETEPPCRFDGRLATPTVLLLCRAITRECLPFLKERVFVVDRIPPWPRGDMAPPKISRFLGRTTFQNLRYIDIRLSLGEGSLGSGWVWGPLVDDLLDILGEWNSFDCLRILFRYHDVTQHNVWHEESKIYRNLVEKVGTQSRINSSRSRAPLLTNNPHVAV